MRYRHCRQCPCVFQSGGRHTSTGFLLVLILDSSFYSFQQHFGLDIALLKNNKKQVFRKRLFNIIFLFDILCLERGYVLEVQLALVEHKKAAPDRVLVVVCIEELPVEYRVAIFDLLGYVSPFHVTNYSPVSVYDLVKPHSHTIAPSCHRASYHFSLWLAKKQNPIPSSDQYQ